MPSDLLGGRFGNSPRIEFAYQGVKISAYLIEILNKKKSPTLQNALRGLSTRGVDLDLAAPDA